MHSETHDAIDRFIELVRKHHPEDVAEVRSLLRPLPVSDGAPDLEPEAEQVREPEPEAWEIQATFPAAPEPAPRAATGALTDSLLDMAKTRRFPFGKHGPKGGMPKTIWEVYEEDPTYLTWCLEECDRLDYQMRQIIQALVEAQPAQPARHASSDQTRSYNAGSAMPAGWGRPA